MKKLLPLLLLMVVAAGCNKEKIYTEDLQGTWDVYKYLLENVDRTNLYDSRYPGYKITFDGSTFTQLVDSANGTTVSGTFGFEDNSQKLVLNYVTYTYTPVTDTAGNVVDSIEVPKQHKDAYTIFNLMRDHVQLRNDSSQLYMRKLPQ